MARRRQDNPWESDPIVPEQPQAVPGNGQLVRRPDGSTYYAYNRQLTNETPTQLLNQGYQRDEATGAYYRDRGTVQGPAPWEADPIVQPEPVNQEAAAALLNVPGNSSAFFRSAAEQAPFGDEIIAGIASLASGQSYGDVRDAQSRLSEYDRQNNATARNLGGITGFATNFAVPAGAGFIGRGAGVAGQAGRAAAVGGVGGAVYGAGAADDTVSSRLQGLATGAGVGAVTGGALQAGAGSIAQRLAGISGVARPSTRLQQRVADFERVGVDPVLAGVGGPLTQRTAQTLSGNIMTGGPVARASERIREQTTAAMDNIASRYGSAEGRDTAGGVLRRGAERGAQQLREAGGNLYQPINQLERANTTPIPLTNAQEAVQESVSAFQTPALQEWFTRNATDLTDLQRVLQSAEGQTTLAEARQLRSIVGRMLDDPEVFRSQSQAGLNRLYGALSDDISAGVRALGGDEAANQLSRADTFYSAARGRANDTLKRFYDVNTDAEAYNNLLAAARTTGNRSSWQNLRRLRDSVTPEEWGDIGSGVIRDLGRSGEDFSVARFATEWEKLTPQARRVLFGGQGRSEVFSDLNALARVARTQREAGRFYNYSESGNVAGNIAGASAIGGAVVAAASGNPVPLIAVVGGGIAGNGLSRILTSPGVARVLARSGPAAVRDADALARRNQAFGQWWSANREAIVRSTSQSAPVSTMPSQVAAEQPEQP